MIAAGYDSVEQEKGPPSPAPSPAPQPRSKDDLAQILFAELDTHNCGTQEQATASQIAVTASRVTRGHSRGKAIVVF